MRTIGIKLENIIFEVFQVGFVLSWISDVYFYNFM